MIVCCEILVLQTQIKVEQEVVIIIQNFCSNRFQKFKKIKNVYLEILSISRKMYCYFREKYNRMCYRSFFSIFLISQTVQLNKNAQL